MSGAGDDRLYVSSWGFDGEDRRWSCSVDGERVCFITVPPDLKAVDVLVMFTYIAEGLYL